MRNPKQRASELARLFTTLKDLEDLDSLEVITLKAHLLVEESLIGILGSRLRVDPRRLPRLTFATLLRLALAGLDFEGVEDLGRHLELLNKIRNDLAHNLTPADQSNRMRELVAKVPTGFDLKWPAKRAEQVKAYAKALAFILGFMHGPALRPDDQIPRRPKTAGYVM